MGALCAAMRRAKGGLPGTRGREGSMEREQILVVDDVELNRAILTEIFSKQYECIEAANGQAALEQLEKADTSRLVAILLDVVMPVMDGFEFLEQRAKQDLAADVPVVLISGDASTENALKAYGYDVADVIGKPFDPRVVLRRVSNIIDLYRHKYELEMMVADQTQKLRRQNELLRSNNQHLIDLLSNVVEFRDVESGEHIKRMKALTTLIAQQVAKDFPEYGLDDGEIEIITSAAALHDIGKIAIPDSILLKPGRLTGEEFEIMKTHTVQGCRILESAQIFNDKKYYDYSYDICRHHHERWDGRGYPDGLAGDGISIAAQIVSLADVYDALTSVRVYKPAYTPEEAMHMIQNGECGSFNPKLLACFEKVQKRLHSV